MSKYETLEKAQHGLRQRVEATQHTLGKFREKMSSTEPGAASYALEWAEAAFEAAADEKVLATALSWVEHSLTDEGRESAAKRGLDTDKKVLDYFRSEIRRQADMKSTQRHASTSVCSNLIHDCERVAWCRLAHDFFSGF